MAAITPRSYCPSCLSSTARLNSILRFAAPSYLPALHTFNRRAATTSANAQKYKRKDPPASSRRKKARTTFHVPDMRKAIQFPLIDAMRYIRAAEVGRSPTSSKYELHIRLRTLKNGPVVRSRLRLPHPVQTSLRICVIAPPDSPAAAAARQAGAAVVGEADLLASIKESGKVDFDRCLCHPDSLPLLGKSGVGRILGPKGLMPSVKTGTVMRDLAAGVRELAGASEYRERQGVIRLAIGRLGFGVEELQENIRAVVERIRRDVAGLGDSVGKEIEEVVLSSTNGPGMSLNGEVSGTGSVSAKEVAGL